MFIKTQNIIVRDLERKDAEGLYKLAREAKPYYTIPEYESPQDYLNDPDWFQKPSDSMDPYSGRYYAVALVDSDEIVGVVAQGPKEHTNEREIGYFMSEKYRRKGFTEEAVNTVVDWCFKVSDIPYLFATISCDNLPSNRLIERCKFELIEKRIPIKQGKLIENESYFYYRKNGYPFD